MEMCNYATYELHFCVLHFSALSVNQYSGAVENVSEDKYTY